MVWNSRTLALLFCVLIWQLIPKIGKSAEYNVPTARYDISNGLIDNAVNDIAQDPHGFIWVASPSGLSRFDGQHFLHFTTQSEDSLQLRKQALLSIAPYKAHSLLLLYANGSIDIFNFQDNTIEPFISAQKQHPSIQKLYTIEGEVVAMGQDAIWLWDDDQYKPMLTAQEAGKVHALHIDHRNMTWACTENGLWMLRGGRRFMQVPATAGFHVYDIASAHNQHYLLTDRGVKILTDKLALKAAAYKGGAAWASHMQLLPNHLLLFGKGKTVAVSLKENRSFDCENIHGGPVVGPTINRLFVDQQENIWIATQQEGLIMVSAQQVLSNFQRLNLPATEVIQAATQAHNQHIWVAAEKSIFELHVDGQLLREVSMSPHEISCLRIDHGLYLAGTKAGALLYLNKKGHLLNSISLQKQSAIQHLLVHGGRIYFASDTTLGYVDIANDQITQLAGLSRSINGIKLVNEQIVALTDDGLFKLNSATQSFEKMGLLTPDKTEASYAITGLLLNEGKWWMGTKFNGLLTFPENLVGKSATIQFNATTGLTDQFITGLLPPHNGWIWFANRSSLYAWHISSRKWQVYRKPDGLVIGEILPNGIQQISDNTLLLTGQQGVVVFRPNRLLQPSAPIPLKLTGIQKGQKSVAGPIVAYSQKVEMHYHDRFFKLSFAALDFKSSAHVQYFYKLDNDPEWVAIGNTQYASFPIPSPGKHTLRVKAIDGNGIAASNQLKLELQVTPPFYLTWWFRILVVAIVLAIIAAVYSYNIRRERKRSDLLEDEVDKRTFILQQQNIDLKEAKEAAQQSSKAKTEFMATMSHEIRTPMNGLMGTLDVLRQSSLNSQQQDYVSTIEECGDNMLAIINEILDYAKIESGKLEADLYAFNLAESLEAAADLYANRAHKKNLDFHFFIDRQLPKSIISDKTRINQVLNNLISNAIKFTKEGFIALEVKTQRVADKRVTLRIEVSDSGIGIEPEKQEKIFEAFSQANSTTTREFGGTGLGLAISRTIAKALNGKIGLKSQLGKGSKFWFEFDAEIGSKETAWELPTSTPALDSLAVLSPEGISTTSIERYAQELELDLTVLNEFNIAHERKTWSLLLVDQSFFASNQPIKGQIAALKQATNKLILLQHKLSPIEADQDATLYKPVKRANFYHLFSQNESRVKQNSIVDVLPDNIKSLKILLAEDNRVNQLVTKRIFKALQLEIDVAQNGQEAIDLQNENAYDLILMDLLMPVVDGKEATHTIRRAFPDLHAPYIIAFSANIYNEERAVYERNGFTDVLSKPAKMDDIKRLLTKLAELRQMAT